MEQIGIFVEEYAEWVSVGSSVVMLILLIYVLHRIKKTERTNLLMNREMEKRLQQIEKESREGKEKCVSDCDAARCKGRGAE